MAKRANTERITLTLPRQVCDTLRERAANRGLSVSTLVLMSLNNYTSVAQVSHQTDPQLPQPSSNCDSRTSVAQEQLLIQKEFEDAFDNLIPDADK